MRDRSRPIHDLPTLTDDDLDEAVGGFFFVPPALYAAGTAIMGSGVAMTALMNPATATRWVTSTVEAVHSAYNYVSQADFQGMSSVLRGEPLQPTHATPAAPSPWDGQFRTMDEINRMSGVTPQEPAQTPQVPQAYDEFKGVDDAVHQQEAAGPTAPVQDADHALNALPAPDYPQEPPTIDTTGVTPQYSDEQIAQNQADLANYQDSASPVNDGGGGEE